MGEVLKCTHGEFVTVPTGNGTKYVCCICGAFGISGPSGGPSDIRWFMEPVIPGVVG